jgi:hypothetical protein
MKGHRWNNSVVELNYYSNGLTAGLIENRAVKAARIV